MIPSRSASSDAFLKSETASALVMLNRLNQKPDGVKSSQRIIVPNTRGMPTLQERFARAAAATGKDDAEIAREAKLTRSAVSYIRTGVTKTLKSKNALKLSSALNVTVQWLVTGEGPMTPGKSGTADNPSWAKDMSPDQVTLTVLVMDHAQHFTKDQVKALTVMVESFIKQNEPEKKRARVKV